MPHTAVGMHELECSGLNAFEGVQHSLALYNSTVSESVAVVRQG